MKFLLLTCALIAAVAADVSHLPSNEYLPPNAGAGSAPEVAFAAPAASSVNYQSAPVAATFQSAPSAPVASFESGSVGAPGGGAVFQTSSFDSGAASAPVQSFASPALAPRASFASEAVEAAPAHTFSSADGYRYKTNRRVVYRHRHRRGVIPNEYLPPFQGSSSVQVPTQDYLPPQGGAATQVIQNFAPVPAAATSFRSDFGDSDVSYDVAAASEPAHTFSADSGYRYRTNRRRVYRRNRY